MSNLMEIESLLFEEESTYLDFKKESYKFVDGNKYQKSEILKDILAFANSWRKTNAYILLGVAEVKGGRSTPVGIAEELDDAQLQEFVNKKTQKPITFTYCTYQIDGKKIAVIEIPVQQRPIFLINDFEKLRRNIVYIRRGSSTTEATPDEIVHMVKIELEEKLKIPELNFGFADIDNKEFLGDEVCIKPIILDMTKNSDIPDYVEDEIEHEFNLIQNYRDPFKGRVNKEYYRELNSYEDTNSRTRYVSFAIINNSSVSVTDINVQVIIEKNNELYFVFDPKNMPSEPKTHEPGVIVGSMLQHDVFSSTTISETNTFYFEDFKNEIKVNLQFKKIQPKQTIYCTKKMCIAANSSFDLKLKVEIYADNLPEPINMEIKVICNAEKS